MALILGGSGNIGKQIVLELQKMNKKVTAGIRDTSSKTAEELKGQGISVIQADMSEDINTLSNKMKGFESVFLNTPNVINAEKIVINAANAAKLAGVDYLLTVTVPFIDEDVLFGRQFKEIETAVRQLGLKFGFLSLATFAENRLNQVFPISKLGQLFGPISGDIPYTQVTVNDAGQVGAAMLAQYEKYINKTIYVTSHLTTNNQQAQEFSAALGKNVAYVNMGIEGFQKSLLSKGVPEWSVNSLVELFELIEKKDKYFNGLSNEFQEITGKQPTTFQEWIIQHKNLFC